MSLDRNTTLPTLMDELVPGERLVVWAFRRWVVGWKTGDHRQWDRVWSEFCFKLGSHTAREALTAFSAIMTTIRQNARRPIRHHQPCCPCIGADEVALASLIAAAQRGEMAVARGIAVWLVRGDAVDTMVRNATVIADRLHEAGDTLPDRLVRTYPADTDRTIRKVAALH
jgi:hypothetical protein